MKPLDLATVVLGALGAHRIRTRLTAAAIAIGIAAVLVLTGLGEGARDWIAGRFAALGSNVLVVLPGRTQTRGGPPIAAATTRDLTLEDALSIPRRVPGVTGIVPIVVGEAMAEAEGRGRSAVVVGSTDGFLAIRKIAPAAGTGLGTVEVRDGARVCVIGEAVRRALFGDRSPLGERIRLGEHPFRVVGVLARHGVSMMVNLDDMVLVPVASAMRLFNVRGVFRVIVETTSAADLDGVSRRVSALLVERHRGEEDFTILTPGAIAAALGKVIGAIEVGLAAIAAISLAVAAVGVMNVMIVSVTERTREVGLMKALGASDAQVLTIFLGEAVVLTLSGGALGIGAGLGLTRVALFLWPDIPFHVPARSIALAASIAVSIGLVFGALPAVRAARMEPLEALRRGR